MCIFSVKNKVVQEILIFKIVFYTKLFGLKLKQNYKDLQLTRAFCVGFVQNVDNMLLTN